MDPAGLQRIRRFPGWLELVAQRGRDSFVGGCPNYHHARLRAGAPGGAVLLLVSRFDRTAVSQPSDWPPLHGVSTDYALAACDFAAQFEPVILIPVVAAVSDATVS